MRRLLSIGGQTALQLPPAGRAILFLVILMAAGLSGSRPAFAQAVSGISSPATGATISGDVPLMGSAVIEPFQKYELHYKLEPSGDDAYVYFDGSTSPVINGQLGVWRAASLPPGIYSIRLRVVKNDGNYAEFFARNLTVNQGPAPTATSSEPTPTPIPTATFTPAPQPTPVIGEVVQPQGLGLPTPTPPEPVAAEPAVPVEERDVEPAVEDVAPVEVETSLTRELGEALSLTRLRSEFFAGVRLSAALILVALLIFGGKRIFQWARGR